MRPCSSSREMASARISRSDSSLKFFAMPSPDVLRMHRRIGRAHLLRQRPHRGDLHEFALTDTGAPIRGPTPLAAGLSQLRPEPKNTALRGLGAVDRAAV